MSRQRLRRRRLKPKPTRGLSAEGGRFTKTKPAKKHMERMALSSASQLQGVSAVRFPNMILNETQCAVRDPVRTFANEEIAPRARQFEEAGASRLALFEALAGLGLIGIATPEIISGAGTDYVSYAMALIEIAAADEAMSTILSTQNSRIVSARVKDGTAAQKAELLPDLIAGQTIGAFVLTEADAGSDASAVHTRATRVEGGYRLNCAKQFLASGCIAGLAAVFAVTDPSAKKRRLGLPRQNECAGWAPPRCR
jgi:alkylation response protein AidB-like acyl-CoA dehydrogenase